MGEISQAVRRARRHPGFVASVVLVLGTSFGVATAMLALGRAVLTGDLPIPKPSSVVVWAPLAVDGSPKTVDFNDLRTLRDESRASERTSAFAHYGTMSFPTFIGDRPAVLRQARVDGRFFEVLGARAERGRFLNADDDAAGARPVAVLSYSCWRSQFGNDESIVGKHMTVDEARSTDYEVVGIAPPGLEFPNGVDYWIPVHPTGYQGLSIVARARANVSLTVLDDEFISLYEHSNIKESVGTRASGAMQRLTTAVYGDLAPAVRLWTVAAFGILILAFINVAGVVFLSVVDRGRELAIRSAMGASPGRLRFALVLDILLLIGLSGVGGLGLAFVIVRMLLANAPTDIARLGLLLSPLLVVNLAAALTLCAAVIFATLALFYRPAGREAETLRLDERAGQRSRAGARLQSFVVSAQLAMAVALLSAAGLLATSLRQLGEIRLGYDPRDVWLVQTSTTGLLKRIAAQHDTNPQSYFGAFDAVARSLRSVPGVVAVSPVIIEPLQGTKSWVPGVERQDEHVDPAHPRPHVAVDMVGDQFTNVFKIPLLAGRSIIESDRENSEKVVVVTSAAAALLWPGMDPLGKRVRFEPDTAISDWRRVVGVVGDSHLRTLRDSTPTIYVPYRQWTTHGMFALRTNGSAPSLAALEQAVSSGDPSLKLWRLRSLEREMRAPLLQPRLTALLLALFSLCSLVLSAAGTYSLLAASVVRRSREIGVRMALGAPAESVRNTILHAVWRQTIIGIAVGVGIVLLCRGVVASVVYRVSPQNPVVIGGAVLIVLAASTLAARVPIRRATSVNPVDVLRGA